MIREKIFRLQRHKSSPAAAIDASAEKIDFTFSNIQALQVPIGWDKLSLSLISSETGKIVRKLSGKGSVRNGTCRWTETLSESIWISDVDGLREQEQHLFKFVIAMGSSRSGILGETTINLAAFLGAESPALVSLPLKKYHYGTILQVEIKCLTPKTNARDEKWKELNERKHENEDHEGRDDKSDSKIPRSSSDKSGNAYRPIELLSRETSLSASVSSYSFDSIDEAMGTQSLSSQTNPNTVKRQDSIESDNSASYCSYSTVDSPKSDTSSQNPLNHNKNQREDFIRKSSHATANATSSKTIKEVDDSIIDVLRAEARMWEQNARKLGVEVESLRKEFDEQCLKTTELEKELAESRSECRKKEEEIEQFKMDLQEHDRTRDNIQKEELEDEIRFQKRSNENLLLQLKKTQESNLELISILQEMEETIEKQKLEMEIVSAPKILELADTNEKNDCAHDDIVQDLQYSDSESSVSAISVSDMDEQILQQTKSSIEIEVMNFQEQKRKSEGEIWYLESMLEDKIIETDIEESIKNQILRDCELEWRHRLSVKEEEIIKLEFSLVRALASQNSAENKGRDHVDASEEIEHLKEMVREIEMDCNDLRKENLALLLELKELRKSISKDGEEKDDYASSEDCVMNLQENEEIIDGDSINSCTVIEEVHEMRSMETEDKQIPFLKHLSDLEEENVYLSERISGLEAQLRYLTETNETSRLDLQHSESQVKNLQDEVRRLEEKIEVQKIGMKEKLFEMQNRWKESQEESKSLSEVNIRLQMTTEILIEDLNSLQKHNEELREQKLKLQKQCMVFEGKLRKCGEKDEVGPDLVEENFEMCVSEEEEKPPKLYENIMENEENLKDIIDELDLKMKVSEIERFRLVEENCILHMQLEKVPKMLNEVMELRISLKEMKLQNRMLEASLESVSGDYKEITCERVSLLEKLSRLQETASDADDCRRKNIALEEKILRMEGDLIARDALRVQDAQIVRTNSQVQMKVKHLEDVREELQKRVLFLEDELKQTRYDKENQTEVNPKVLKKDGDCTRCHGSDIDCQSRIQILEKELARALEANQIYKTQVLRAERDASEKIQSKEIIDAWKNEHKKISLLEAELQEIRERYLKISLKYAEVEDQREQLVMKLKTLNS